MGRKGGPLNKVLLRHVIFNHEELIKEDRQEYGT